MPGSRWFPDARLNYAENLLGRRARDDAGDALVFWGEDKVKRRMSHAELYANVARTVQALRAAGVSQGRSCRGLPAQHAGSDHRHARDQRDRRHLVVGVARLRRAGRGRPLRPDRAQGARSRSTATGTTASRSRSSTRSRSIAARLPSLRQRGRGALPRRDSTRRWTCRDARRRRSRLGRFPRRRSLPARIDFEPLPFDHPLYIIYSSGTTGVPKCIVHGAGGTLLQHVKEHRLHSDIKRRRPAVLLHDLRLDDVELAGIGTRVGRDACCCSTAARSSIAGGFSGSLPNRSA